MSLSVQNLFIRHDDRAKIVELVETHLRNPIPPVQPDWGLHSSFDRLIATDVKRKVIISPPIGGWVALVESKGFVDFALANALSERLETTVLVIQLAEVSGAAGFAGVFRGKLLESYFNDEDADPLGTVRGALEKYGVPFDVILFREAIQKTCQGWSVKQKRSV